MKTASSSLSQSKQKQLVQQQPIFQQFKTYVESAEFQKQAQGDSQFFKTNGFKK
jgi:hypothetical protein